MTDFSLCEYAKECPIHNLREKEEWRKKFAEAFCRKGGKDCMRRRIRKMAGKDAVPKNLLPDGNYHTNSVFEVN